MANSLDHAFTPALKLRFLDELSQHGNVRVAAARCGVSRSGAYLARRRDAAFDAAWCAALVEARWHAEAVLAERALEGVEEEVYYRGELVGSRRRYDTRLLLAHLARLDALCEGAESRGEGDLDLALAKVAGIAAELAASSRAQHLAKAADAAGKRFEGQTAPPDPDDPYDYDPETAADYENPVHTASREVDAAYEEAEARYDAAQAAFVAEAVDRAAGEWDAAHGLVAAAVDAAMAEGVSPPAEVLAISGPIEIKSMGYSLPLDCVHCVHSAPEAPPGGLAAKALSTVHELTAVIASSRAGSSARASRMGLASYGVGAALIPRSGRGKLEKSVTPPGCPHAGEPLVAPPAAG